VTEAALGNAPKQRHLPTLEEGGRLLGAGAGPLAFTPAAGGLAVAAPRAAPDPFAGLALVDAVMNSRKVHYRVTPRRRATSSRVRRVSNPWMVAFTRLIGLVLPCTLVRML